VDLVVNLEKDPVASSRKHRNECSGFIKGGGFLGTLSNYHLLKDSAPPILLVNHCLLVYRVNTNKMK
jgi:hypothetical protein